MTTICDRCEKDFKQEWRLERHLKRKNLCKSKTDNPNTRYSCNFCQKDYKQKCHLTRHLKTCKKNDEKEYKCDFCNRGYKYNYTLNKHLKTCKIKKEKEEEEINFTKLKKQIDSLEISIIIQLKEEKEKSNKELRFLKEEIKTLKEEIKILKEKTKK